MSNPLFNSSRFRLLDYDDFLILRALANGHTVNEAAKVLGVTQPAVSIRLRKMSMVFGMENIMAYKGRNAILTPVGQIAAEIAIDVLARIESFVSQSAT